jgi:hypothetical protein
MSMYFSPIARLAYQSQFLEPTALGVFGLSSAKYYATVTASGAIKIIGVSGS